MVGWVKLNSDGSVIHSTGEAACGGILKDCHGSFIRAFSAKLGNCTAINVKLWGACIGLRMAFEFGYKNVLLELDSRVVVQMIAHGIDDSHAYSTLVKAICLILSRDWIVQVSHVYREINSCADLLAKHGHVVNIGVTYFVSLPSFVSVSFLADLSAAVSTRIVGG